MCLYWQVSPSYSREVAGNPAIAPHLHKFQGIINGIDPDIWDPFNDEFIPVSSNYLIFRSSMSLEIYNVSFTHILYDLNIVNILELYSCNIGVK